LTALNWASYYGKNEIAEILIKGNADVNNTDEVSGFILFWFFLYYYIQGWVHSLN